MKNLITLSFAIILLSVMTSCKKDYTCSCSTENTSDEPNYASSTQTSETEYNKVKRNDVELTCTNTTYTNTYTRYDYSVTPATPSTYTSTTKRTCTLK